MRSVQAIAVALLLLAPARALSDTEAAARALERDATLWRVGGWTAIIVGFLAAYSDIEQETECKERNQQAGVEIEKCAYHAGTFLGSAAVVAGGYVVLIYAPSLDARARDLRSSMALLEYAPGTGVTLHLPHVHLTPGGATFTLVKAAF